MELIRVMLYKFQQRKKDAQAGSQNLPADYASVARLPSQLDAGGLAVETPGGGGLYSPLGTTSFGGGARRSPSLGSKIIEAELEDMAGAEHGGERWERSPPKARKIREEIKYGVQEQWKKKFNPADILHRKFYAQNPSHYGRIMKKKIPEESRLMAQTLRQQYEHEHEHEHEHEADAYDQALRTEQDRGSAEQAMGQGHPSRQTSPPVVAEYDIYGYAPKYESSPAQPQHYKAMQFS